MIDSSTVAAMAMAIGVPVASASARMTNTRMAVMMVVSGRGRYMENAVGSSWVVKSLMMSWMKWMTAKERPTGMAE